MILKRQVEGNGPAVWVIIFALAATVRGLFAVLAPGGGGDTESYATVALNVLNNFCVSQSDPAGGQCAPSWGGNQGPGYPVFVAAVWATVGSWEPSVRLAQGIVAAAVIARVAFALSVFSGSRAVGMVGGIVLALSPLQVAWSRMFLTESLALAATTLVLAELILSLAHRKLRIWQLGLTLTLAIFVRYDSALLAVPIIVAAFYLHGWRTAVMRGAVIAVIATIPLAAWGARSAAQGLGWIPPRLAAFEQGAPAYGYFAWAATWAINQYDRSSWAYPIPVAKYSWIEIPAYAYRSDAERSKVQQLLKDLANFDDQPIPARIDDGFAAVAAENRMEYPVQVFVVTPLRRAADMWVNPFYSYGWPSEIDDTRPSPAALIQELGPIGAIVELVTKYPSQIAVKGFVGLYRYGLIGMFLLVAALAVVRRNRAVGPVWILALSYVLVRTIVFSASDANESRYMIEAVPFIEAAVVLWIMSRQSGVRILEAVTAHRSA